MQALNGYNTYIGVVLAALPVVLNVFGYHLAPGASDQINSLLNDLVTLLGSAYALYGRARASTPGFLVKNPTPSEAPKAQ